MDEFRGKLPARGNNGHEALGPWLEPVSLAGSLEIVCVCVCVCGLTLDNTKIFFKKNSF